MQGYTVFSIPVGVVYRPNEAKVKNLKTKDYLGKARLVAASDRNNAFLGFQGSEMKRMNNGDAPKDDRPSEGISYAATNLVQKNLSSRTRQQSEPPINRNVFPPTPPPESDKGQPYMGGSGSSGSTNGSSGRSASTRRPPRLDLEATQTSGPKEPTGAPSGPGMPQMERLRIGTSRTASEPRGPSRSYSNNMRNRNGNSSRQQPQLYRETTNSRRQMGGNSGFAPVSEDGYPEDVYDMYGTPISPRNMRGMGSRRRQPKYVEPEDDYNSEFYEDDSADEADFEMVGSRPPPRRRATSRKPEIRKIRVKAHADGDTRYIMIGPAVEFGDFEGRIREKFGFRGKLKIKMQDDGDMITMGDQDDLDLLLSSTKQMARKEKAEMGKMEVCIDPTARIRPRTTSSVTDNSLQIWIQEQI